MDSKPVKPPVRELFETVEKVLSFYAETSCPCAFPRFIQVVSLDCTGMNASFTCRETEALLSLCREQELYRIETIDADFQSDTEYWTCRTCGSRFLWGWSDTVVKIDRQYLKPVYVQAEQCGADAALPIPLFGGFFGKKLPSARLWLQVSASEMAHYMTLPRP